MDDFLLPDQTSQSASITGRLWIGRPVRRRFPEQFTNGGEEQCEGDRLDQVVEGVVAQKARVDADLQLLDGGRDEGQQHGGDAEQAVPVLKS